MLPLLLSFAVAAPPPWAQDLATGDCAATLAALPSPVSAAERLAAGTCANRLGKDGEAWLAAVDGPLAPYARLERAHARLRAGDGAGAVGLLEGVSLPGSDDERVRTEGLVLAGRHAEAAALAAKLPASPSVALLRAKLSAASGADPVPALNALWVDWPTSAEADEAARLLQERGQAVPDPATTAGRARMLARAAKLVDLSQAPMAIPLFDAAYASTPPASSGERLAWADALYAAKAGGRDRAVAE